ncbi:Hypothetical protein R9X50_00638400 [Acrodontium crateriforme]|uniref:DUF4484 domain-containing protein n=1 Tax=Acrodontium crateriforme TaxID=150365 RepID=A0AAQ3M8S6_9PEZI|nr:Hypothetical protein R9X50_00638400 [Acrodontium crateriforme]
MDADEPPQIAALFLVVFDQKVGYTIAWKRSLPGLDLDGVEYKSLPSGLHAVPNDLVYFIHDAHAGVSAFVKGDADASARNASFVAVGALVPLSNGRMGRAWLHAQDLRRLGEQVVTNFSDTAELEKFWEKHGLDKLETGRRESIQNGSKRKRAYSDATLAVRAGSTISHDHPALAMSKLLDLFGPLMFPLYRAALLRRRILLLGSIPVQNNCDFVYILSVLSSIPHALDERLPADTELRIQPLFSVGIHDIPALSAQKDKSGWVACTTDDILGEKHELYDFCVEMPKSGVQSGAQRQWPKIRSADGKVIKATQRDLRRYRQLRRELGRLRHSRERYRDEAAAAMDDDSDEAPLISGNIAAKTGGASDRHRDGEGDSGVVEPLSWKAMAYNGFMWWASAGEQMEWEQGEEFADYELLSSLPDIADMMAPSPTWPGAMSCSDSLLEAQGTATILTAYFHRFTTLIVRTLADIVEHADDATEQGVYEEAIAVTAEDVRQMGLQTWNEGDKQFVVDAMQLYFGRESLVGESGVRICGARVC